VEKENKINYFRYVDDILLIFDSYHTDIQAILVGFNTLHPNLNSQQKLKGTTS